MHLVGTPRVEVNKVAEADRLLGLPLFGGYVITRKIGTGGMGAVYLVENAELGKKLAIKVLLPDRSTSPTATSRFLAEARGASAINHRNIITIIDASELPDGRHYILMEHLEGTTLRRYARGLGPMPVDVTLAILAQVCSGLQAAHDRGIIHRDLKPSNIFVTPQPDNPYFTKILDFGIAKLEDPALAGEIQTKSQTVAGTPNYMSPEQARALRDVDHRSDIYSVGVMAYELLTGRLPYKAKSVGDLVYQQSSTTPVRISELRKDIPRAWDEIIHSAIQLEPANRPSSAQELARLLMEATPRGEAIARATASLLFTSVSDVSNVSIREDASFNEDDRGGAGPISRTLSVVEEMRHIMSGSQMRSLPPLPSPEGSLAQPIQGTGGPTRAALAAVQEKSARLRWQAALLVGLAAAAIAAFVSFSHRARTIAQPQSPEPTVTVAEEQHPIEQPTKLDPAKLRKPLEEGAAPGVVLVADQAAPTVVTDIAPATGRNQEPRAEVVPPIVDPGTVTSVDDVDKLFEMRN